MSERRRRRQADGLGRGRRGQGQGFRSRTVACKRASPHGGGREGGRGGAPAHLPATAFFSLQARIPARRTAAARVRPRAGGTWETGPGPAGLLGAVGRPRFRAAARPAAPPDAPRRSPAPTAQGPLSQNYQIYFQNHYFQIYVNLSCQPRGAPRRRRGRGERERRDGNTEDTRERSAAVRSLQRGPMTGGWAGWRRALLRPRLPAWGQSRPSRGRGLAPAAAGIAGSSVPPPDTAESVRTRMRPRSLRSEAASRAQMHASNSSPDMVGNLEPADCNERRKSSSSLPRC